MESKGANVRSRFLPFVVALALIPTVASAAGQKRDLPDGKGFYILVLPKDHDPKKTYDLVIALHGMGDTAQNYANCWTQYMGKRETILAVPEGSVKAGPGFSWNDEDISRVKETLEDAVKNFGADRKRVMLHGFSAGCAIGFLVVSKMPDAFACYGGCAQCVEPFVNKKELEKAAASTAVYYAVGKKDPNHPGYQQTVDVLTKMKFNLVNEDPDIGHTITEAECKKMLELFDSTADKVGQARLVEAKKLLDTKSWGPAETALTAVAAGKGPSANEAHTLLENMTKDFTAKLNEAKALPGPDAVEALKKLQRDFPGTTLATQAKDAAEQIAKDPATTQLAEKRRVDAIEAGAQAAWKDAEAQEKAVKLQQAQATYERIVKDFPESTLKAKAEAAAARLKADPRLIAAKNAAEADKLLARAENFMANGATAEAKEIFVQIVDKFPDTSAAKTAKEKAAQLK
jgi:predicted esterase